MRLTPKASLTQIVAHSHAGRYIVGPNPFWNLFFRLYYFSSYAKLVVQQ